MHEGSLRQPKEVMLSHVYMRTVPEFDPDGGCQPYMKVGGGSSPAAPQLPPTSSERNGSPLRPPRQSLPCRLPSPACTRALVYTVRSVRGGNPETAVADCRRARQTTHRCSRHSTWQARWYSTRSSTPSG
jgi:hypothetical protein